MEGVEYLAHPLPEQLLAAGLAPFRECGLTSAKARCLGDLARRASGGKFAHERFADLSDDDVLACLTAIPGVGQLTAEVVLVYGLGRNDVFMPGDRALANAVRQLNRLDARPSPQELLAISAAWRPWRIYAAAYLLQASRASGPGGFHV